MKLLNKIQDQYEQLWKSIVRPTRCCYPLTHLGPQKFHLQDVSVQRVDFQLTNQRGYVFYCSHFIPSDSPSYACIVYCHGNSSNRTEGMEYLGKAIKNGISVCTFDFSGCGNAQGDYVTLGYHQQNDLALVIEHIHHYDKITWIALWGRSMGAVTSLLYLSTYQQPQYIKAVILDSPFKSLKSLIEDICKKHSKVPMFILSAALKFIASTIEEKAKFSIYKINPLKNVCQLSVPAMFIVGTEDEIIPPKHTMDLFAAYATTHKQLIQLKGKHNDTRSDECVEGAIRFIIKAAVQKDNVQERREIDLNDMLIQEKVDFFQKNIQQKEETSIFSIFGIGNSKKSDAYQESKTIIRERISYEHSKKMDKQNKIRMHRMQKQIIEASEDDSLNQIIYNMKQWSH